MRALVVALAFAVGGCISAPPIVIVDRATALEQQASGSMVELEQKLVQAGSAPRPVPLTPAQLSALGIRPPPLVDSTELTDADRIDGMLKQHCVGEARDGTLVETADACEAEFARDLALVLIERANHARLQLWRWMQQRRPGRTLPEVRRGWREAHLRGAVCGAWLQREDGGWEAKKC